MRIAIYIARFVAIVLGLALLFTLLGVYDTDDLPFYMGFTFWASTMLAGIGASELVVPIIWDGRFKHWPAIAKVASVAALVSIPVTFVLWAFSMDYSRWGHWDGWAMHYMYVLIISLVLTSVMYLWRLYKQRDADGVVPADTEDAEARFMDRLPIKYRGAALYAVSSEDHYLRVHTDRGEEMILMRLADAVRELAGAAGLQTHRSWWVASDGVADSRKAGGKLVLVLKSGGEAPVSRTFQPAVKEAGLA